MICEMRVRKPRPGFYWLFLLYCTAFSLGALKKSGQGIGELPLFIALSVPISAPIAYLGAWLLWKRKVRHANQLQNDLKRAEETGETPT
jgi:hypothetical protein